MKIELSIPTSWGDVTLKEFISLNKLNFDSYDSPIEYYAEILQVFGNENVEAVIQYFKITDINSLAQDLSFMQEQPVKSDVTEVEIDKVKYKLIQNMNLLTVGEYISIETLIESKKLSTVEAMSAILSVILRPEDEEFDAEKIEDRIKLFENNLNIEDVLGMSVFFFEWRKVIMFNYSALFGGIRNEDDDDIKQGPAAPTFSSKWKWFSIIERLSDGDITKFETVYRVSYISALNLLSYWKEKDDYNERLRRRQEMMSKHK